MKLIHVKEILNQLSAEHNDIFDIDVIINKRFTRTLGRVTHSSNKGIVKATLMELSAQLLEFSTEEEILSVIKHEWAHYYITKITGQNQGHNAQFKALCDSIGCHGTIAINLTEGSMPVSKYTVTCAECGEVIGNYSRKCKTVTQPELYKSNCCNAKLKVVQNF